MIRLTSVVFPAPVGPTIATVWPGAAVSDKASISGVWLVAERGVVENDLATNRRRRGQLGRFRALFVGVEEFEDPLGRCDSGLHHVGHGGDLGQRLGELARVLDERLNFAQAERSAGHPYAP